MPSKYVEEVKSILRESGQDGQDKTTPDASDPSQLIEEVDVYIEPDRITLIPKKPAPDTIIDSQPASTPAADDKASERIAYAIMSVSILMILSIIMLQIHFLLNPPIATITLVAKSQTVTLSGTLQLGRVIAPITLSQSATAPATGKGHQDARSAIGYITFYNGLFTAQTVPAGTILTGADGVQIITDQTAFIPAANPPTWGIATVSAHALNSGSSGNIAAFDINQGCCATAIKAVNTTSFRGGQDARDFKVVTKNDIHTVSTMLKTTLAQAVTGALEAQLKSQEQLNLLPCTPIITSDHRIGEEANQVKVTASETCSGIAYNAQELLSKATQLLTAQAEKKLGAGYSLLGEIHTTITQAIIQRQAVILSFSTTGTWGYALTTQDQEHLKQLIAGKSKEDALKLLQSIPGIERAGITWEGRSNLPIDTRDIHLNIFVV